MVIFSADWRTTGRKWIWQGKQISSDLLPRNSKNETDVVTDIPVTRVSNGRRVNLTNKPAATRPDTSENFMTEATSMVILSCLFFLQEKCVAFNV